MLAVEKRIRCKKTIVAKFSRNRLLVASVKCLLYEIDTSGAADCKTGTG